MGAINTTYTFTATDTITSTKMNDIIDQTTFTNDAVFDTTLFVASGKLKVNAQGITSNELANNAVTTDKVANLNITTDKVANLNITTDKIAESSVTNNKLSTATGEIGAEWQSYTPVFTLGGGSSTNGNAVITGRYVQIGKTIHFKITYILGTTTAYSNLTYIEASLPVAYKSDYLLQHPIGNISYHNVANVAPGAAIIIEPSKIRLYCSVLHSTTTGNIYYNNVIVSGTTTRPFAFSANSNNQILISGCYESE